MREFSTNINNALVNGLKPSESFRDTMFFDDLLNIVPNELSAESYQEIKGVLEFPDSLNREEVYPFPQWLRFEGESIIVMPDTLYSADESYIPFDLEYLSVKGWEGFKFKENFRSVDYGDDWILVNSQGCLYKRDGEVFFSDKIKANAIVKDKNRTLIGGAVDGLWTDGWIRELKNVSRDETVREMLTKNLGSNFVAWSSFDSHDLPFGLLYPDELKVDEMLYHNQFGFMEMPFRGAILDMISSLDQVFLLGEDGICSIVMNGESAGAGYVITGSQPIGIKCRGAVGGDESSFVFIDKHDQLWRVSQEGMEMLDFSDYMSKLGNQIYVTKDPDQEIFYIGDKNESFLLRNRKLTRIYQTVSHASGAFEFRAGVAFDTDSQKARIKTQEIDLGINARKTLTGISINLDSSVKGRARAFATVNGQEVSSPWTPINNDGYARVRLYGKNHQLEIELDSYKDINIDNIELKWQVDDNRQTRGIFATQDGTGAG